MPLPFYNFSIRNRILEHEVSLPLSTNDPYRILSDRPFEFWMVSGETVETFENLLTIISPRIVIDNQKNICYVYSGFLGHNNDAFCYQQIRQIGPGLENDFPAHCLLLADSIYPNAPPL
ncbi:Hypothetical predicted protein, partial [Mytilus galloprovincialis]